MTKHNLGPGASIEVDWFGGLPAARMEVFETYTKGLECSYYIFSISLDEAISLHESGLLAKSFQVVALASELCTCFSTTMDNVLRSLADHCSEHEANPAVAPLNPADFRNDWSRLLALKSLIWHNALLAQKSQFHKKARSMRSMVSYASRRFCTVANALAIEGIADSSDSWAVMDRAHFDLNTCLRESFIMLKSFLRVLPDEELRVFQENVSKGTLSLLAPHSNHGKSGSGSVSVFHWNTPGS